MSQESYKSQSLDSQIDLRYIFRTLKKNAVFILMCVFDGNVFLCDSGSQPEGYLYSEREPVCNSEG